MIRLPDGEKNFDDMFICFDRIQERAGHTVTDRRTDRHRMTT